MVVKNIHGTEFVEIRTKKGVIRVYEAPDNIVAGVNVDFMPDGQENVQMSIPLMSVENGEENPDKVILRVWGDPYNEDYTNKFDMSIQDIRNAVEDD